MADRYFKNTMIIGPDLDGDDVTRAILKAAAAALKVMSHMEACASVSL